MIYLASPYSHPSATMRQSRYEAVREAVGLLWKQKVMVFSPIIYTHEIAKELKLPFDAEYWKYFNTGMQSICHELWILKLSGWTQSVGIRAEILLAKKLLQPVFLLSVFKHDYTTELLP